MAPPYHRLADNSPPPQRPDCLSAFVLFELSKIKSTKWVSMKNGILEVTLSNPEGIVTGIHYNGIKNLLETKNDETNR
ncbi:hypothetical protein RJ640_005941, partial [Escallonia rubra]